MYDPNKPSITNATILLDALREYPILIAERIVELCKLSHPDLDHDVVKIRALLKSGYFHGISCRTPEGFDFWNRIITSKDFSRFSFVYIITDTTSDLSYYERILKKYGSAGTSKAFIFKSGSVLYLDPDTRIIHQTTQDSFEFKILKIGYTDVTPIKEYTRYEIAKALGISVDKLVIKN